MQNIFIGHGYDIHKIQEGGFITLGGININCGFSLVGHSDADVLLHAVTDAILGASCLGDIGTHFCDKDQKNKNISSVIMLEHVLVLASQYKINNLDCTIITELPRMRPYIKDIKDNLQRICKTDAVNIKAKTNEGMDSIGKKEAMVCHCVVTLYTI